MRSTLVLAALAGLVFSAPASADRKCANTSKARWQPISALQIKLTEEGYKIRKIKTEGGCYEVYATDKNGSRANLAFNAETLEKMDNPEAGEN